MIAWAQGYHDHQVAHPHEQLPPVVPLSHQTMGWTQHGQLNYNHGHAMGRVHSLSISLVQLIMQAIMQLTVQLMQRLTT